MSPAYMSVDIPGCHKVAHPTRRLAVLRAVALGVPEDQIQPYFCWRHQQWHWSRQKLTDPSGSEQRRAVR